MSAHLLLGARPESLIALDNGFVHNELFSLSAKSDTPGGAPNLRNTSMTINMLCFFAAWTPPSVPGLFFPTYMGLGALTQSNGNNSVTSDPTIFLLGLGVGYEFDLGAHVHLGPLLRADFGNFTVNSSTGADLTVLVPALMLSATYDMGR